ncbi:MAG: vWA domain-containing protein [Hyphomicrobiaceae bacterium]
MSKLINLHRRWAHDARGNVGIIFALTALPVFGMVGLAVDYGSAVSVRNHIQSATDAAALAAAAAQYKTTAEREQIAINAFRANTAGQSSLANLTPSVVQGAGIITVNVTAQVPTSFMRIMGYNNTTVEGISQVATTGKKLELALMFDVTGSMDDSTNGGASSKINDAKAAAVDLLDVVMPATAEHNTRMSLIPFSQKVKLDADTIAAVSGQEAIRQVPQTTTKTVKQYSLSFDNADWKKLSDCITRLRDNYYEKLGQDSDTAEANAEAYCLTLQTRWNNGKKRTEYLTPDVNSQNVQVTETTYQTQYINPCVVERNTGSATRKIGEDAPANGEWVATYGTTATADVSCPPNGADGVGTLVPLTTSRDAILDAVNALQTGGSTAGQIGTAWSWYTLSPNWNSIWKPSSQVAAYGDTKTIKAAVLMTDGAYNSCNGSSSWCAASATQAVEICNKMKEQGIQVWTIGFGMSTNVNDPARQTLVQCADTGRYFFPYNGTELRAAFSAIGRSLSEAINEPRLVN